MKIKGSSIVEAIQTVGLRTNEGFIENALTGNITLDKFSKKHLYFYADAAYTVTLPNATTLPTGWTIYFYSKENSLDDITINDYTGSYITKVKINTYSTLILVDNTTAAGKWKNITKIDTGNEISVGVFRNVVTYAVGDVIVANSGSATVGNFLATCAEGADTDGKQIDTDLSALSTTTLSYTPGVACYFYIKANGTIVKELYRQTGGEKLNSAAMYPAGSIYYSISDGMNYKQVDGAWVEYPCVAIGEITSDGIVNVYGFNFWWWLFEDLTSYSQMFYNADYATTSIQLNYPCPDPKMLTVIVGNTVLLSNAYTYNPAYSTITFQNPIAAGTYIEVKWYVPLTAVDFGDGALADFIKSYTGVSGTTLTTDIPFQMFNNVLVFLNGQLLASDEESGEEANDYYISGSDIIFHESLDLTDKVTVAALGNNGIVPLDSQIGFVELNNITIDVPA